MEGMTLELHECLTSLEVIRHVGISAFGFFDIAATVRHLSGQDAPQETHKVRKLKRLSDEVLDSQPREVGVDSLLAIGTGKNHFQAGSQALRLFENLPA
jgi:hypothetical protein